MRGAAGLESGREPTPLIGVTFSLPTAANTTQTELSRHKLRELTTSISASLPSPMKLWHVWPRAAAAAVGTCNQSDGSQSIKGGREGKRERGLSEHGSLAECEHRPTRACSDVYSPTISLMTSSALFERLLAPMYMGSQKEVPLLAPNPENIRLPGCLCEESIPFPSS